MASCKLQVDGSLSTCHPPPATCHSPPATRHPMTTLVHSVAAAVLNSRKYQAIAPELVEAIAAAELSKGRSHKEAVKATKNQLHRSAAVYQSGRMEYDRWLAELQMAWPDATARQPLLRRLMTAHASTSERLPFLDDFYTRIFALLPPVHSVLDIACGLNPLAHPWMPLAADAFYLAVDIFSDQITFLNDFFRLTGVAGRAETRNVLTDCPADPVDLALILKTIPCLEQMEKDAGAKLLGQVQARHLVVSFPSRSLGGRQKGMESTYAARFAELTEGWDATTTRLDFANELVFVVGRGIAVSSQCH
ncbi:MAG: 16S rRNA methyltransferase [Chloroflexi bacterium]|nr:16S rRNA methyltransferase [Chloroflexota bacterium]